VTREAKTTQKAVTAWLPIDEVRRLDERARAAGRSKAQHIAELIRADDARG
jgi:hypothetical protein